MQITCMTTVAAWEVMQILRNAGFHERQDFHFDGPELPDPPINIMLHVTISFEVACQLLTIAGITIEEN